MAEGSESTEDLMKKLTNQLDIEADILKVKHESGQEVKVQTINSDAKGNKDEDILPFLKKFADEFEKQLGSDQCLGTEQSSKSELTLNCENEQTENLFEVADVCTTQTDPSSLTDLLTQLHHSIKKSDWLEENTAEKWATENPELAKPFIEASKEENHKE